MIKIFVILLWRTVGAGRDTGKDTAKKAFGIFWRQSVPNGWRWKNTSLHKPTYNTLTIPGTVGVCARSKLPRPAEFNSRKVVFSLLRRCGSCSRQVYCQRTFMQSAIAPDKRHVGPGTPGISWSRTRTVTWTFSDLQVVLYKSLSPFPSRLGSVSTRYW